MRTKQIVLVFFLCFVFLSGYAQIVNLNPDPNGEQWLTGGVPEVTPDIQAIINQMPHMTLQSTLDPPDVVDNSQNIFMRPIFNQKHGCCAQASGVGYVFTYEINWLRNIPANDTNYKDNWYPTHFTYNFLNNGLDSSGSFVNDGWDIV